MARDQHIDGLIASLEDAVDAGLAYFAGAGARSDVRAGEWGPREVLCHMVFWHQTSVEGMESVSSGGPPKRLDAPTDELNAAAVESMAGQTTVQLVDQMRGLQSRLVTALQALPDPSITVLVRNDGAESSAIERLQRLAIHWREHMSELDR